VGYVYVFRHGDRDQFKIGRTANVEKRLRQLQTGSPKPLTVFAVIETADAKDGEAFLHQRLAHKCLIGENFALTPEEMQDAMAQAARFLEELPQRREVQERLKQLNLLESNDEMLPPTTELVRQHERLLQIRAEKAQRMADIADLTLEEEHLEAAIKLAIGAARGIDGVATWQTRDGRRRFDPELVKSDDPELYAAYLSYVPKFESARFKADAPEKYAAHQVVHRDRSFHLMTDVE
jgi:Meiotically Up-regulated Gene 113 (MUG113) protein